MATPLYAPKLSVPYEPRNTDKTKKPDEVDKVNSARQQLDWTLQFCGPYITAALLKDDAKVKELDDILEKEADQLCIPFEAKIKELKDTEAQKIKEEQAVVNNEYTGMIQPLVEKVKQLRSEMESKSKEKEKEVKKRTREEMEGVFTDMTVNGLQRLKKIRPIRWEGFDNRKRLSFGLVDEDSLKKMNK